MRKLYESRGQKPDSTGRLMIGVRVDPSVYRAIDRARGPGESRGEWVRKIVTEALKAQTEDPAR